MKYEQGNPASFFLFLVPMLALSGCTRSEAVKLPDPEVLVARPLQQDVPVHREWVATLDGYVNADSRPQVSGYIISQKYKEGGAELGLAQAGGSNS